MNDRPPAPELPDYEQYIRARLDDATPGTFAADIVRDLLGEINRLRPVVEMARAVNRVWSQDPPDDFELDAALAGLDIVIKRADASDDAPAAPTGEQGGGGG